MTIDWQLLFTQIGGMAIVVTALAWLARSFVRHSFGRDLESHKAQLKVQVDTAIEALRIHDKDRTEAHKRLFVFAKHIANETFPLADDKRHGFITVMKGEYWDKLELDQVYFSDRAAKILDHFESMFVCMRRGELSSDTAEEVQRFLEDEVFLQSEELSSYARLAMRGLRSEP